MSDRLAPADLIANRSGHLEGGEHDLALTDKHRDAVGAAIADYDRVLQLNSTNADALFKRSALHRLNGDFDKAATDFDRAIQSLWRQRERIELPPEKKTAETVAPSEPKSGNPAPADLGAAA